MFSYVGFGLGIRSALPLPELQLAERPAEVEFRYGRLDFPPAGTAKSGYHFLAGSEEVYLFWEGEGAYLIRGGREIIIDPAPGVEDGLIRLTLLGPAMAVLLHQRGLAVLHASGIGIAGEAVAFLGEPGEGKSSLAAFLLSRGHDLLADDIVAVDQNGPIPQVIPGFPQLKLRPELIRFLGGDPESLPLIYSQSSKRAFRIEHAFSDTLLPLRRIYVLMEGALPEIRPLSPQEAVLQLVRHTYRIRLLHCVKGSFNLLQCANLAKVVPIRSLKAPRDFSELDDLACLVEKDLAAEEDANKPRCGAGASACHPLSPI